jgi:hypothetical protein
MFRTSSNDSTPEACLKAIEAYGVLATTFSYSGDSSALKRVVEITPGFYMSQDGFIYPESRVSLCDSCLLVERMALDSRVEQTAARSAEQLAYAHLHTVCTWLTEEGFDAAASALEEQEYAWLDTLPFS